MRKLMLITMGTERVNIDNIPSLKDYVHTTGIEKSVLLRQVRDVQCEVYLS